MARQLDLYEEIKADVEEQLDEDRWTKIPLDKDMLEVIDFDDAQLDEEYTRYSGDLAYWNARYVKALRTFMIAQHIFKKVNARLWLEIREEAKGQGEKMTTDDLKCAVIMRDEYEEAHLALIEAEAEKERMRKFAESLQTKRDMLQSFGAKLRAELEGDPSLRKLTRDVNRY